MTKMNRNNVKKLENIVTGETVGVTHGGEFHTDEVFATAVLWMAGMIHSVARVNSVPENLPKDAIVYDIGGIYDPAKGRFDHHQKNFYQRREEDSILMSSAGLVWAEYGGLLCKSREVWEKVDSVLFRGIDAVDNGMAAFGECMTIASVIDMLNPNWDDENVDINEAFVKAVNLALDILASTIARITSKVSAKSMMDEAIAKAEGKICVLDRFLPWTEYVANTDLLYVIFPSDRGGYMVQCVAQYEDGKPTWTPRKSFPEEWRGLRDKELAEKNGIAHSMFCHPLGFCGGAYTLPDAVAMAIAARDC